MTLSSILLIAVGLVIVAFDVSITCGLPLKKLNIKHSFTTALSFGFFSGGYADNWLVGVSWCNSGKCKEQREIKIFQIYYLAKFEI